MARQRATLIAFLAASVVPTVIGGILTIVSSRGFGFSAIVAFAALSYVLSVVFAAILGMPLFLLLLRSDLVRWWTALPSGFLVGAVVALIVRLPAVAPSHDVLVLGFEGVAAAGVFWLIWRLGQTTAN